MKVSDLFKKDIHRNIQGVVKIGQDTEDIIKEELDEYVVTKELNRHFDKFFEHYRKGTTTKTDKIGVWISGFFGSGKSHFLKILSYLLSNDTYGGVKAINYFDDKIADNRILADMKLASDVSCDIILFNIDAKSDADSKVNKDAIVKVFMKVFNEMQGFCSSMPWIADLERQMSKDGVFENFKASFKAKSGYDWEFKREDYYFEEDNIISSLAETTKMSIDAARSWYNKCEDNYSLDVMTFAKKVREYIEVKSSEIGKKHNVIFLCDEIGQYIGSDDNLMLNLQTIVENLGTECGGRAWVIATSQQDIDSITKVNRDNFSKIIGRFDTKLSLSSANVDEVIKKRLLEKTDVAKDKLRLLYNEKAQVLKNLITFTDNTPNKKTYKDEDEFVEVYPFIPYQFNLLQAVFTGIRTHGASGKHLSEGERSLLNAFQEAAISYSKFEDGVLISFDTFYKTIETFLDHNIRAVIIHAETNERLVPADIAVLKVLFMVKYIDKILPANIENLATIMLESIDQDRIETKKAVDQSLRRLEHEKLITKNGSEYAFLTNEEQDINREIKDIIVERSELIDKLGDEIFSVLFGLNKKFRYSDRHDFAFNQAVDDRPRGGQKEEIGVKVITPLFSHGEISEMELKSMAMRERNVIVCLPSDMSFVEEMEQALQIELFIRRNATRKTTNVVEDIKTTKIREAKERHQRCSELIFTALKSADIYVNHNKLNIREKEPTARINDALKHLIDVIYTKQNYITHPFYTIDDLKKVLTETDNQLVLDGTGNYPNQLAIEEMTDVITKSSYKNMQTTMSGLKAYFNVIPFAWKEEDTAGILLTLFKNQEVKLEMAGETLLTSDLEVINYVTKRDFIDRLIIKVRAKISLPSLANVKMLAKELFDKTDMPSDEDGLMYRFKELIHIELYENNNCIKELLKEYETKKYPGKKIVEQGKKLFDSISKMKDVKSFYDYLMEESEMLLDYEEDMSDVKKFFKNQREVFNKALDKLLIYEKNRSYVLDIETINIVNEIEKITNMQSPYADIHKLPDLIDSFNKNFSKLLEAECEPIKRDIEADKTTTFAELDLKKLEDETKTKFGGKINVEYLSLLDRLSSANNIYEAIAMRTESDRLKLRFVEEMIAEELRQERLKNPPITEFKDDDDEPSVNIEYPKTKTVSMKTLFTNSVQVKSEADVDKLLDELRLRLISQLEENTIVRII